MLCVPYAVRHDLAQPTRFDPPAETPSINHHSEVVATLSRLIASHPSVPASLHSLVRTNAWAIQIDIVHIGAEPVELVHPVQHQTSLATFYRCLLAPKPGDSARSEHVPSRQRIYSFVPTDIWAILPDTDHTDAELETSTGFTRWAPGKNGEPDDKTFLCPHAACAGTFKRRKRVKGHIKCMYMNDEGWIRQYGGGACEKTFLRKDNY
ncbi:hypothetical protein BKA82DRAFT_29966 [Pisolithus tinctorius]|uniref:Uncharacterized protein n=1 Tax=Pisolithus tinctorius Marx 270 TaxID=870435 RepID=A0A0C3ISP4_PISTI|nr:hypothetical protein BKA82DRAFT_29966 [Pisolithus tinctorius]KIN99912.1 hypothetical protein M404DRAFT_29966 [Pisolithus tinctorius Marx 270]